MEQHRFVKGIMQTSSLKEKLHLNIITFILVCIAAKGQKNTFIKTFFDHSLDFDPIFQTLSGSYVSTRIVKPEIAYISRSYNILLRGKK